MKKLTTEEFIERARQVHGDKYDYSKVEYLNWTEKICIICPIHGEFLQTPKAHLSLKQGCPSCWNERRGKNNILTTEQFIEKTKKIHEDRYDYSKVEYKHSKKKVCIICPIHGEFWQTPNDHLHGYGCPLCGKKKSDLSRRKTKEEFIEQAVKVHGNKYDYSKVEYIDIHTKVCIICPIHGEFWQDPCNHLNGANCPKCKESKYELEVRKFLDKNNINYMFQYRNKENLGSQTLDFFIAKYNIGIECQGIQHFEPIDFGGKGTDNAVKLFEDNQKRDNIKIQKCKENGIKLIHYNPFEKYFGTYENEVHKVEELEKMLITA